jgi:hypothetical protein
MKERQSFQPQIGYVGATLDSRLRHSLYESGALMLLAASLVLAAMFSGMSSSEMRDSPTAQDGERPAVMIQSSVLSSSASACSLESNSSIVSLVSSAFAQFAVGAGDNGENLSEVAVENSMIRAWFAICGTPAFDSAAANGGPLNLSVGIAINAKAPEGNGTFSESWANSSNESYERWTVNLATGLISGPTFSSSPLVTIGGPTIAHKGMDAVWLDIAAVATGLAAAVVMGVFVWARLRRQ